MNCFTLDGNDEIKKRFASPFNSAGDYCEALEFFEDNHSFKGLVKTLHYMLRSFMKAEEVDKYSLIEDLHIGGFDLRIPGDKRENAYISVTFNTASSSSSSSTKVTGNVYHSINEIGYKFTLKDSWVDGGCRGIRDLEMKEVLGGGSNDYEYTTCQ